MRTGEAPTGGAPTGGASAGGVAARNAMVFAAGRHWEALRGYIWVRAASLVVARTSVRVTALPRGRAAVQFQAPPPKLTGGSGCEKLTDGLADGRADGWTIRFANNVAGGLAGGRAGGRVGGGVGCTYPQHGGSESRICSVAALNSQGPACHPKHTLPQCQLQLVSLSRSVSFSPSNP